MIDIDHQGIHVNKLHMTALAAAIVFTFSAGASAALSKDEYKAGKDSIKANYKTARAGCDAFAANARDICVAEAKGKEAIARAELEEGYKPGKKNRYNVSVAKADAAYKVASEKCDDKAGNDKDVCVKEAKAVRVAAKADATTVLKTTTANQEASEKTSAARAKAGETSAAARQDAATEKRNAEYAVAKEKCEKLADDARSTCIKDAKIRYGQS